MKQQVLKESSNGWENYGDINFLEYGGSLLKQHPEDESVFDVFMLNTDYQDDEDSENEDEEKVMAYLCHVDISDSWINKKDILFACGLEELWGKVPEERIMTPQQWAREIVEYYSAAEFSPITYKTPYPTDADDYVLTREELETWLKDLGAWECIECIS